MKLIKTIPYSDVKFKFISSHYDIHLDGSCIYNNQICKFKTIYPNWNEESDTWDETLVDIYSLSYYEKFKMFKSQWLFEQCVGYHWSYDKKRTSFYYRNPKWLYKLLFNFYYKK